MAGRAGAGREFAVLCEARASYGPAVTGPLDLQRIMTLVADAMEHHLLGASVQEAAALLVEGRRPTARELAAARRENHEVHGGAVPVELSQVGLQPTPVPAEIASLRRSIDQVLTEAARLVGDGS